MEDLSKYEGLCNEGLLALYAEADWGTNPEHLQSALALLREHPRRAQFPVGTWAGGAIFPLRLILDYREATKDDIQWVLDLYPDVLKKFDFLHWACGDQAADFSVIKFFAVNCPKAIAQTSSRGYLCLEDDDCQILPIDRFCKRCCDNLDGRPEPLAAASNDYWTDVREICDLLWVDGKYDFVDRAVEVECWPLVSYFVSKAPQSYWEPDEDRAWWYRPQYGIISAGALEIINQLLLPKFRQKLFTLTCPSDCWASNEALFPWIRNHPDLRLLSLDSPNDHNIIAPGFTDALLESLTENRSLQKFILRGDFHVSWDSFARLLSNAPNKVTVQDLVLSRDDQHFAAMPSLNQPSNLCKLDMFQVTLDPQCLQNLIQLLTSLPQLRDLLLVVFPPRGVEFDTHETTNSMIDLLRQDRLKRLTFGDCPLDLMPMCEILRENQSLECFEGCFDHNNKPEDFRQLLEVMKNNNRALKHYGSCSHHHVSEWQGAGIDKYMSMGGFRERIVFYIRSNRIEDRGKLGRPEATPPELIDLLLRVRTMISEAADEEAADTEAHCALWADEEKAAKIRQVAEEEAQAVKNGILGSEVGYFYDLLHQQPLLWAGPSLARRGKKRKAVVS